MNSIKKDLSYDILYRELPVSVLNVLYGNHALVEVGLVLESYFQCSVSVHQPKKYKYTFLQIVEYQ